MRERWNGRANPFGSETDRAARRACRPGGALATVVRPPSLDPEKRIMEKFGKSRLVTFVAALLIALGSLGLSPAVSAAAVDTVGVAAVAEQRVPTCPDGILCWFDWNNWQGPKYMVDIAGVPANTCFNMGTDPFGTNWNDIVDSVWWNETLGSGNTYAEFYEGANCTVIAVARAWTNGVPYDQMNSCTRGIEWNGPCGPPNNVAKRISSWAYNYG